MGNTAVSRSPDIRSSENQTQERPEYQAVLQELERLWSIVGQQTRMLLPKDFESEAAKLGAAVRAYRLNIKNDEFTKLAWMYYQERKMEHAGGESEVQQQKGMIDAWNFMMIYRARMLKTMKKLERESRKALKLHQEDEPCDDASVISADQMPMDDDDTQVDLRQSSPGTLPYPHAGTSPKDPLGQGYRFTT